MAKYKDMVGYEFHTWKVLSRAEKTNTANSVFWLCECQICHQQKIFNGSEIRRGNVGACKHKIHTPIVATPKRKENYYKAEQSLSNKIKDETGNIYGRLKVLSFSHTNNGFAFWNCRCNCGKEIIVRGNALRTGAIKSCGCLTSYKEEIIVQILQQYNIKFQQQYTFPDLKDKQLLRFDFAIFNQNNELIGLIEYQGRQHYELNNNFNHNGLLQIHDKMKKEYCEEKKINLLELNKNSNLENDLINWYNQLIK